MGNESSTVAAGALRKHGSIQSKGWQYRQGKPAPQTQHVPCSSPVPLRWHQGSQCVPSGVQPAGGNDNLHSSNAMGAHLLTAIMLRIKHLWLSCAVPRQSLTGLGMHEDFALHFGNLFEPNWLYIVMEDVCHFGQDTLSSSWVTWLHACMYLPHLQTTTRKTVPSTCFLICLICLPNQGVISLAKQHSCIHTFPLCLEMQTCLSVCMCCRHLVQVDCPALLQHANRGG